MPGLLDLSDELLRIVADEVYFDISRAGPETRCSVEKYSFISACTSLRVPGEESFCAAVRYFVECRYLPGLGCEFTALSRVELARVARALCDWDGEARMVHGEDADELINWPRNPPKIIDPSRVRLFLRVRHGRDVIGTSCVHWKPSVERTDVGERIKMTFTQSLESGGSSRRFLTPLLFEKQQQLTPEFDFSSSAGTEYIQAAFDRVSDVFWPDSRAGFSTPSLQVDAVFLRETGEAPRRSFEWAPLCKAAARFDWDCCEPHGVHLPDPDALQVVLSNPSRKQGILWALRAVIEFSPVDELGRRLEEAPMFPAFDGTSSDGAVYGYVTDNFMEVNLNVMTRLEDPRSHDESDEESSDSEVPNRQSLPLPDGGVDDDPQEHLLRDVSVELYYGADCGPTVQPSTLLLNRLRWL